MPRNRKKKEIKLEKMLRIFCEGEKTEPNYINGYINLFSEQERKKVITVVPTKKNTPVQLVEAAVGLKNSSNSLPGDVFWVVYDRESIAKYTEKLHKEARLMAKANGIKIALNNVCFEYWILLHFVDTTSPYTCFDELDKRSPLNAEFKKSSGSKYKKSNISLITVLQDKIPLARERGKKLNKSGFASAVKGKAAPSQINPYVGMVMLLDAIDNFK